MRFNIREDLLEFAVVDLLVDDNYAGTATIKADLLVLIGKAMQAVEGLDFDIEDQRKEIA